VDSPVMTSAWINLDLSPYKVAAQGQDEFAMLHINMAILEPAIRKIKHPFFIVLVSLNG